MSAPAAAPKKEVDCLSPEAQKLAEARLAAKRAARAEAREIRMKELERQQKEVEEKPEKDCTEKGSRNMPGLSAATLASLGGTSSRRGSGDTSISLDTEPSIREIKDSLAEVEEKYKKAMVSNAQLDNEKTNFMYQVDTLKDVLLELEEQLAESRRQYEEKNKELEREKHAHSILQFQFAEVKEALRQREEMLEKHGIIINSETATNGETPDLPNNTGHQGPAKVTTEQLSALRSPGDGPPGRTSGVEVRQDNVGQSGMAQDPKRPRPREDAAQDGVDRGVLQPGGSVEDQRTSGDSAPFPGSLGNARDEEQVENHIPDNTSFPERPEPAERREATTLSALGSGASLEEPGASLEEPGASLEEPGASLGEPGASLEEPGASLEEPGASSEEPSWAGASENQVPGAGNRPDIKNHSADSTGMQEEEKLEDLKNSSGGADPNLCPEPIAMETSGGDRTSRLDPMEQSRDHTGAMEEAGASHAGHRGTEATGSSRDSEDMASHDGSPEAPAPSTGQGPGKEPATQEGPVEGRGVSRENSAEEDGEAEVEAERVQGVAASPAAGDSHRQAQQATGAESSAVTTKEPEDKNEQQGEAMEPSQKKVKNKKKKNKKKKAATAAESQADTRKELACEEAEPGQAGDEQAGPADPDQAEEVQKEPLGDPEQETTAGSSENPECPGTPESTPDGKLHQEDGDTEATAGSITAEGDTRGLSSDTAQAPGSRASDEELNGNAMKADTEKDGAGSTLLEDASPLEELRDTSHTAGADTPAMCDQPSQTAGKAAGGHGSVEDGNLSAPEGEEGNSRVGAKGVSEKGRAKEDCTLS